MTTSKPIWVTPAGNIGTVYENNTFVTAVSATDATSYYLISGDLPSGISLNTSSGLISGKIPVLKTAGTFTFTIRASNAYGIADRSFNIIVQNTGITWNVPSNLGTILHKTFYSLMISASEPGVSSLTYEIISGSLPAGLTFDTNGLLSGYITIISSVSQTYTFTIQATGTFVSTKTFTIVVTTIGSVSPQWNTIGAYQLSAAQGVIGGYIGNITKNIAFSFQLKSVEPFPAGALTTTYSMYSGVLPTGITLSSSGLISGTYSGDDAIEWPFTVQISNGINSVVRVFYLKTNSANIDNIYWLVDESLIPVDFSEISTGDIIDFTVNSVSYQLSKTDITVEISSTIISNIETINALPLATTLLIQETNTGLYSIYKLDENNIYTVYYLQVIDGGTSFIFSVGTVIISDKCTLVLHAVAEKLWVRYEVTSGTLPLGLYIDTNTGNICGQVQDQTLATYNFTVSAYNFTTSQPLDFSITVGKKADTGDQKLTYHLSGYEKTQWMEFYNKNLISPADVYRSSDENYGIQRKNEIVILSDVIATTTEQAFNILDKEIPTWLMPSEFISTPVIDSFNNVICDCVSLKFIDSFRRAAISHQIPIEKNPAPNPTKTVYPGGLDAIRNTLISGSKAYETYEDWMNYSFSTSLANNWFVIVDAVPGFLTGDKITFDDQILPSPFKNGVDYYVIPVTSTEFRLADSEANAFAGTYILFSINEITERSGTLKTFIAGIPLVYVTSGTGDSIASLYNSKANITPYGYYNITDTDNKIIDTFFQSLPGHNLATGDPIIFDEEFVPQPFNYGNVYYAIVVDDITFKLASSYTNALANTPITIISVINDQTNSTYVGAFKKVQLTNNGTVQVEEVNLRFSCPVNTLYLQDKYDYLNFSTVTSGSLVTAIDQGSTGLYLAFNSIDLSSGIVSVGDTVSGSGIASNTTVAGISVYSTVVTKTASLNATNSANVAISDTSGILTGMTVQDESLPTNIPDGTEVSGIYDASVTSKLNPGMLITDRTTPSSIPDDTIISAINNNVISTSRTITSIEQSDTIVFYPTITVDDTAVQIGAGDTLTFLGSSASGTTNVVGSYASSTVIQVLNIAGIAEGMLIVNQTSPGSIPAQTIVVSIDKITSKLTLNNTVTGVTYNDVIAYYPTIKLSQVSTGNILTGTTITFSLDEFDLTNHGFETGDTISFSNQVLPSPLVNDTVYYIIRDSNDYFRLALTYNDALNALPISFNSSFSGLIRDNNGLQFFINTSNTFTSDATYTDSKFTSTQTSLFNTGDVIQLIQTVDTLPAAFSEDTNYYVIPITSNTFRLATSMSNAQTGVFITFTSDFSCDIIIQNNNSEVNWRQYLYGAPK